MRLFRRFLLCTSVAVAAVFVFPSIASAQAAGADAGSLHVANIFDDTAQLLALVGGVIIPFVVALLTKYAASENMKRLVAFLSAALLALGTYITDTSGSHTWKGALSVFVVALVIAAASRYTITGGWDTKLGLKTQNFGIGSAVGKAPKAA